VITVYHIVAKATSRSDLSCSQEDLFLLPSSSETAIGFSSLLIFFTQPWPADALELVANKFLETLELTEHERTEIVPLCQHFHTSARHLSEQ